MVSQYVSRPTKIAKTKNPDEYLNNLRHSAAHLLAAAVMELHPKAKRTIGPSIENGFYYDFDDLKISEEDLPKIEAKMHELVKDWQGFERKEVSPDQAKKDYKDNPYKLELIDEFTNQSNQLTYYLSGSYSDLCRGGHIDKPSEELLYFKLLKTAGAYWRGSEKNKMLTRIYGTAFPTKEELESYLKQQELAEENDHREIGKKLGLFVFSDLVGKGLPLLTPKGATIRRELERFVVDEELKRGYLHVVTPPLANLELYKTSGHYPYYKDTMYPPMKVDEDELMLRPMTCPHHFMLYKSQQRSYRELPMKIAELAYQFRYEKSGELSGLSRVREFTLADAHIITPADQAKQQIKEVLELIDYMNKVFGMEKGQDYRYRLSLGDRKDEKKYYKDDKAWDFAESILRSVLDELKAPYFDGPGEAAFYGPKIDVQVKNSHGHEETAFTVQYDFVMPKRFRMSFINSSGDDEEPVVVHRSSIGAIERTMAFLIEKYKGAFPTWLAPVQVVVLPIADRHTAYAANINQQLTTNNIRSEIDDRQETLSAKIRDAQMQKIPYMIVIGDKELEAKAIAIRQRDGKDLGSVPVDEFIKSIKIEITDKKL